MTRGSVVFVLERAAALRDAVVGPLVHHGFTVTHLFDKTGLVRLLHEQSPDVLVLGPSVAETGRVLEALQELRLAVPTAPILLIASKSSEELAIAALRAGINEYIKHPFCPKELAAAVERCMSQSVGQWGSTTTCTDLVEGDAIIGDSVLMRELKERLARIASGDSTVLVTGETGTGKELIAALVHKNSPRRHKPFQTINCAAIPDSLLESELFGYEKGAFTGAQNSKEGKLRSGDGGTVFLDEIGDMSAYGQAKILRLIEGKEIQRLGRDSGISVNVRFIAATNQNLEQLVRDEKFRKDLYFRLNVVHIHLPPLRERKEDLFSLVNHYIRHFNRRLGANMGKVSDDALDYLLAYDWPGNVRELKNLLEGIFVDLSSGDLSLAHLPPEFRCRCAELKSLSGNERVRLLWALTATNWNKSKAAGKLKWSRMTLYRKMAQYNISKI